LSKKVLFIGHSAGHTGAPIILFRLLNWLKKNTDLDLKLIIKLDGPLKSSYEKVAPVMLYNPHNKITSVIERLFPKGFKKLNRIGKISKRKLTRKIKPFSVDLIFTNTITNGEILSDLSYLNCPVICRVAELNYWINRSGRANLETIKKYVTHYIAVSEAVKQNLINNHTIPEEKISVVHGFISPPSDFDSGAIRKKLNIPEDGIIVGGTGSEVWRKGKDLFIQLAIAVLAMKSTLPIYFVWLGAEKKGEETYQLEHDILNSGLSGRIFFIPDVENPMDCFADFDMFAMVSREDPYPIVNLEMASLSKPILCFENAGGSSEFVENDAGFILPYLDINAMAEKVILLAEDKELRACLGKNAAKKVMERHDISIAAPKILKIINHYL
jgi:glycosyltransferase involved in cell wall biosynthesis